MNEIVKRDGKKGELLYLKGIDTIHMKHMELLSDLMQHPTLRTEIPNLDDRNDIFQHNKFIHTELEPPIIKPKKIPEEKTE